jgi:HK97 family phage major capsid protein
MKVLTLKGAQQREADLAAEGRALFALAEKEDRDLTDEELSRDDTIAAELDEVRQVRARLERQQDRERNLRPIQDVNQETEAERIDRGAPARAEGSLADKWTVDELRRALGESSRETKVLQQPRGPWKSFGDQLITVHRAGTGRGHDSRLDFMAAASGSSEAVAADGGYLIHPDYSNEILRRMWDMGHILSRVRKIPLSANTNGLIIPAIDETSRATGSRWGGVQGYWLPEGGTKLASKPAFRMLEMKLHKLAALMYVTDELLADAPALTGIMNIAMPEELNFLTEDSFVRGTGGGQPLGILNSGGRVTVDKESGQAAATINFFNITKMYSRMYMPSMANAAWFINQEIFPQLQSMSLPVGTAGVPVYMPANGLSGSPFSSLLGLPVIPTEYNSALGTEGDIILADWTQYLMIDKGGIETASSIHVRFINDETAFRFVYRVDGQPVWNNVVTPYKGSLSRAPFVTLATRA